MIVALSAPVPGRARVRVALSTIELPVAAQRRTSADADVDCGVVCSVSRFLLQLSCLRQWYSFHGMASCSRTTPY